MFIPFVGEDLEFYCRELRGLDLHCLSLSGPLETYRRVQGMDRMVAMRYHSVIFSLLAFKPVMVLAYARKVVSLAEELGLSYADLTNDKKKMYIFNNVDAALYAHKLEAAEVQMERISANLKCGP